MLRTQIVVRGFQRNVGRAGPLGFFADGLQQCAPRTGSAGGRRDEQVAEHPQLRHLIVMCSAVNAIDASALESIEAINHRLSDAGVSLHLSEVKGPVMDALERSHLLHDLTGSVWRSQNDAFSQIVQAMLREAEPDAPADPYLSRGLI